MVEISTKPFATAKAASSPVSCAISQLQVQTESLDPLLDPAWDSLALSHPDAGFFHSSAWAKVLCKTYGHRPAYFQITRSSEPVALVPIMEVNSRLTGRRGVSLPFTDFCNPLLFGISSMKLVMEKLAAIARERGWKHFEVRSGPAPHASATPSATFYGHELDLRHSAETLFAGFASSVRRAIRKAEKSGLNVQVTRTREAVLAFYTLHIQTRRKHGLPPQPSAFFLNIYEEVIARDLGFIVLAKAGECPVAAAMYFRSGKKAVYKFGASAETSQETRSNNLVMWAGIRHLASCGAESLHFGRSSIGNAGLRRFKLGWGTKEETLQYFRFDPRDGIWLIDHDRTSGFHTAIFRRLPLALNRIAGTVIYPHLD